MPIRRLSLQYLDRKREAEPLEMRYQAEPGNQKIHNLKSKI
jgi:hypothetical protein